jgi:oligoribonuclease NrnB/cAMP/cGMP phosphodiesterase (DHH superfamily)
MNKPLIIYHGSCFDGFGAAWAAWLKFGDEAEYRPYVHGMPPPTDWFDRHCYVLDFSFPKDVILDRKQKPETFMVIDHHKTAQEDLKDFPEFIFDMNKSGAVLSWNYFHDDKPPRLLQYVQDRDLWQFKLEYSREIDCWIKALPFTFKAWSEAMDDIEDDFVMCTVVGSASLRYQNKMVKSMCDNAWVKNLGGFDVPVTNASVFFSDVADELCRRNPKAPFAAYFFDRSDGRRQWGLRSINGFDVSEIAKKYGGGGHAAASGFQEERP